MLPPRTDAETIIVSGLPRSGTSMLMRILQAGGIPLLTDGKRPPDQSNRFGYFEFDPVKKSASDIGWFEQARGKAVKVIAPLLHFLPPDAPVRLLVIHRPLAQVMASQQAMLARTSTHSPSKIEAPILPSIFAKLMFGLPRLFQQRPHWQILHISYELMLHNPCDQCRRIATFLGDEFDTQGGASAVDFSQHRIKK